jgi:hypothetical protein
MTTKQDDAMREFIAKRDGLKRRLLALHADPMAELAAMILACLPSTEAEMRKFVEKDISKAVHALVQLGKLIGYQEHVHHDHVHRHQIEALSDSQLDQRIIDMTVQRGPEFLSQVAHALGYDVVPRQPVPLKALPAA